MDGAAGRRRHEVPQRRKPAKARALVVFARGEQQVRWAVVMHILAVHGIPNGDWTLVIAQHSWIGREKNTSNSHDMANWACQKGDQSGEQAEGECSTESHDINGSIEWPLLL